MQAETVTPPAGTVGLCTSDLVLIPKDDHWLALNKANWHLVGHAKVHSSGQLEQVLINPPCRRQGFASQIRRAFPEPITVDTARLTDDAKAWLKHLGWDEKIGGLPRAANLDFSLIQRRRADHWTQRLKIPADYSQSRKLPLVAEPARLQCLGTDTQGRAIYLTPKASQAWADMKQAAANQGITLEPVSGFRSIAYQGKLVSAKIAAGIPMDSILSVSAAPGYSEHHSGAALDLCTPGSAPLEACFADTPAFTWLSEQAQRWDFVMSYPPDNPHRLAFEPWHWCFRGG